MPESFQDRSFRFALEVIRIYRVISSKSDAPKPLAAQMIRAGTAVGANLAEAKSASSRRDLIAKNAIALREARECSYWLRLVSADQPRFSDQIAPIVNECEQLIAMLTTAIKHLRGS